MRPLLIALTGLFLLGTLAACGQEKVRHEAQTEGIYLDVGPLQYQIQISRQLNPRDTEDKAYFVGVEDPEGQLNAEETWFAIFIKVWNRTGKAHESAESFEIEDTDGKVYEPVEIGRDNVFAYRPARVPPDATNPLVDSAAETAPTGGSLLLFKLSLDSLANRPLEFKINPPDVFEGREAVVDLDV